MESKKSFLDCLTGFLADSSGMTTEEVRRELQKDGIDTKELEERTKKILDKYMEHG